MSKLRVALFFATSSALTSSTFAQVTLAGTSYTQNFDAIGSGLPSGWTVSTSATLSSLGTPATFSSAQEVWNSTTNAFRNIASNNIALSSNTATQNGNANRALGFRPIGANAGEVTPFRTGAITVSFTSTLGFQNFALSLDLFQTNSTTGIQTYKLEYRLGESGDFTQIGTDYTTIDTSLSDFNIRQFTGISLAGVDNQASTFYIRLRGVSTAGSSNLDTIGIDNFSLTYSPIPEPSSFVALAGLATLGFAATRRRRRPSA